ncbi:hypothetical protein U9M48_041425 [Paspalum notatum var. saurae]|uniref:Uncharacterized protein n=1 Tax=Paspalum notatum var. saurae TaxID=547442 RepID=A0AAQ3UQI7_PASNO
MSEPTIADVVAMLQSLTTELTSIKADVAAMKEKSSSSADSSAGGLPEGPRDLDRPPRFQKLDFPRYDGKSDPMLFINKCESYFTQQRTMAEEHVWMASYHLEDVAQLWYIQLQEDETTPTWGQFKDRLTVRFGPPLRSAPLFELTECRRTGTVEEYSNRFQALLPRAGRLAEAQRVQLFTGGLLPPLSHAVRIHNPATLAAAMSLARQVELMELDRVASAPAKAAPRALLPPPAPRPALQAPALAALPAPPPALPAPPVKGGGQQVKRLSPEEQAERRRLGLCYNCNEPYSRGHNHVCRLIFYIGGVEIAEEGDAAGEADPEAPVFSLRACPSATRCRSMSPEDFRVDLYVMPLAGYDLVLGTQWMVTLGPIVWDFNSRTLAFTRQDREVRWSDVAARREPLLSTIVSPAALLEELLSAFTDIFAKPTGLPPQRARDHSIVLKPGALPVAVRPYRYPAAHKDELERQALNALTVKDTFPIPVVDELLDELHGARFFTKLDLRSGYHQVRMRPADIHKTAFRTHDGLYEFLVMAFGLCNAPATFQALMNDILRPFLRRFVLVFFDDILIYSHAWADHLRHVRAVFSVLRHQQLFLKRSKCAFATSSVAYLGHVVSAPGVAMDPAKVQAVLDWPRPRSARAVPGFLGLTGYYRKFVPNYGTTAAPLSALLKKDGVSWSDEAAVAFTALKEAMTSAPVLAMPDFSKTFIVECDASSHGFGAVLVQDSHPIAFFSRPVAPRHRALAAYERELIAPLHHSQHHWVGKLLGFDFTVEYKPGHTNGVADALSRRDTPEDGAVLVLSAPRFDFIERLRQQQEADPALVALREEILAGSRVLPWAMVDGMVQYSGRLYVPPSSALLQEILVAVHEEGHEGVQRTLHRLRRDFHFPNMKKLVQDMVRAWVWTDIAMDFVEALPRVRGKSVILTVVDRFSKYCHFIPLAHPYSAETVAHAFFVDIVRLHGVLQSIVSDRDTVFTSNFWRELMRLSGTKLQMTTAFHPQSDGQSESANRVILMYLRCLTGDRPREWLRWLPWAEYIFNTAYQSSLRETPFRVVYGRDPPSIRSYEPGETQVAAVAKTMEERTEFLEDICGRLLQAQEFQKRHYDRGHRQVTHHVGDWVLLRLRQRPTASMPQSVAGKLKPRFYGPYRITELINDVAVRLDLPPQARLL